MTNFHKIITLCFFLLVFSQTTWPQNMPPKGDVVFFSTNTRYTISHKKVNTFRSYLALSKSEPRSFISYSRYIHTVFSNGKMRLDVDIINNPDYPNPASNTFVYDGSDMYFWENVYGTSLGKINENQPIRSSVLQYVTLPAFCLGYDFDGIKALVSTLKTTKGLTPSIKTQMNGEFEEILGTFPAQTNPVVLGKVRWLDGGNPPFKEAYYLQPGSNVIVKIQNNDFQTIDGVLFPKQSVVQVRAANSIEGHASGQFIIDATYDLVDAKFNSAEINPSLFSTEPPAGFKKVD